MKYLIILIFVSYHNFSIAQTPTLILPIGHTDDIHAIAVNHNGNFYLSASEDNTAKVWDLKTGKLLLNLLGHSNAVLYGIFSPNDQLIATASMDSTIIIWNAITGKNITRLRGHNGKVDHVFFTSNNKFLISSSPDDSSMIIWPLASPNAYRKIKNHGRIIHIVFDQKSNQVLTSCYDSSVSIRNVYSGRLIFYKKENFPIASVAFSAVNKLVAIGTFDGTIAIQSMKNDKKDMVLKRCKKKIASLSFSHDHKYLFSSSFDGTTNLWDINGKFPDRWPKTSLSLTYRQEPNQAHNDPFEELIFESFFSPDNSLVAALTSNGNVYVWGRKNGSLKCKISLPDKYIDKAVITKDGKSLLLGFLDGHVSCWNINENRLSYNTTSLSNRFYGAIYSSDNTKIITSQRSNFASVWDANSGVLIKNIFVNASHVNNAKFTKDSKYIVTTSNDSFALVLDGTDYNFKHKLNGGGNDVSMYMNPERNMVITRTQSGLAKIWDLQNGTLLSDLNIGNSKDAITFVAFNSDGKLFGTLHGKNIINIWRTDSVNAIHQLKLDSLLITSFLFLGQDEILVALKNGNMKKYRMFSDTSIDFGYFQESIITTSYDLTRNRILTSSTTGAIGIFNASTGKLIYHFFENPSTSLQVRLNPSASEFMTMSYLDNTVRVYDATSFKLLYGLTAHKNGISSANYSPDGKNIITSSWDNTCRIWSTKNGELIATLMPLGPDNFITQIPFLYYRCSYNAARFLHYVTRDLKVVSFQQLDIKYNRPDKVLEHLGGADSSLILKYWRAYNKRIELLKIDTTSFSDIFSFPTIDFEKSDSLNNTLSRTNRIKLRVMGSDRTFLDRFNIFINGVPLYGTRGINLEKNSKRINVTKQIILNRGRNLIELSLFNVNQIENLRTPIVINYQE
jgi:WD40 repeat protein